MARVHFNNFLTTITGAISDVDTSFTLATSIPSLAGNTVRLTLFGGGFYEVIEISSNTGAPTYTIARAKDGTSARAWASGTSVECRITAGSVDDKQDALSDLNITTATVATNDKVLIQDTDASDALKTVTVQSIVDLASGGAGAITSFTPTMVGLSTAGTGTYTTQRGYYCVIGDICFIDIRMTWTAHTGTGDAAVGGLPFEGRTGITPQYIPIISAENWNNAVSSFYRIEVLDSSTTATIKLQGGTSGEGGAIHDSAATLHIQGFYFID